MAAVVDLHFALQEEGLHSADYAETHTASLDQCAGVGE